MGPPIQYFRVRIRAQIFRPDLGSVRPPPLLHLLINTNLLTSCLGVHSQKCRTVRAQKIIHDPNSYAFQPATSNISCFLCLKLLCFLLCFISYEDVTATQIVPIFFFFSVSLLLPLLFTSRYSPLLYSEFLLSFF